MAQLQRLMIGLICTSCHSAALITGCNILFIPKDVSPCRCLYTSICDVCVMQCQGLFIFVCVSCCVSLLAGTEQARQEKKTDISHDRFAARQQPNPTVI